MKILIVGAGITGAVACRLLRQKYKNSVQIEVWDKAKGVGGRMSTSRSPSQEHCIADLGAQYITTDNNNILSYKDIYDILLSNDLLEPFSAAAEGMVVKNKDVKNFVMPRGVNSVVKCLLDQEKIVFKQRVKSLVLQDNKFLVFTEEGLKSVFDVVILTIPVPQILQLEGCVQDIIKENKKLQESLNAVKYSSRYALAYFYDSPITFGLKWDVKFLSDDPVIRYISIDNRKRNRPDCPTAVVIHSTTHFGKDKIDCPLEEIQCELTQYVDKLFPTLPKPISVKCQKWRYSQIIDPYPGRPGYLLLRREPYLIACGDSFTESNLNGCIETATSMFHVITSNIQS